LDMKDLEKKIFLIVSADPKQAKAINNEIVAHVSKPTIYIAEDGTTAISKVKNVTPHVVITDAELPKISGFQFVETILRERSLDSVAVIIASHPPAEAIFVDEIVTGRVQFLTTPDGKALTKTLPQGAFTPKLIRALNYVTHSHKSEYYLRFLAAGDVLLKEGDRADNVYIVKRGLLRAFRSADGKEIELGQIKPGEFVGEMAYVNGEPRSATVTAIVDCELIEVPIESFDAILFQRPSWSRALMATLSKRLRQANQLKS
jgi:CRP/FNR family cyclic AMP-dependent transcriptional regulator